MNIPQCVIDRIAGTRQPQHPPRILSKPDSPGWWWWRRMPGSYWQLACVWCERHDQKLYYYPLPDMELCFEVKPGEWVKAEEPAV